MNKKTKSFPLPLSSVMEPFPSEKAMREDPGQWRSTQTAILNQTENRRRMFSQKSAVSVSSKSWNESIVARSLRAMIDRLVVAGIKDPVVLDAIGQIPRHLFVEPGLAVQAYADIALPIGAHQTISKPSTIAKMIEMLRKGCDGAPMQKILEIGTGCGYQAAILAKIAKEVYSVERIKILHELARQNLRPLRIANLRLHYGDGMLGLPQVAPFDGIILAAAGSEIPKVLLDQLAVGGRLIAPVGLEKQTLQLVRRLSENKWETAVVDDCHFVPLQKGTA